MLIFVTIFRKCVIIFSKCGIENIVYLYGNIDFKMSSQMNISNNGYKWLQYLCSHAFDLSRGLSGVQPVREVCYAKL